LIHDAIAAGTSQYGMQTFDQSLFDLYSKQLITLDEALARASNADEFKLRIQGIRSADAAARKWPRKWPTSSASPENSHFSSARKRHWRAPCKRG